MQYLFFLLAIIIIIFSFYRLSVKTEKLYTVDTKTLLNGIESIESTGILLADFESGGKIRKKRWGTFGLQVKIYNNGVVFKPDFNDPGFLKKDQIEDIKISRKLTFPVSEIHHSSNILHSPIIFYYQIEQGIINKLLS